MSAILKIGNVKMQRHSFILDLEAVDNFRPLVYVDKNKKRIFLEEIYHKYEVEFYDVVKDCAKMIDEIEDYETRLKYHQDLSRIFVIRHKTSLMRLFSKLFAHKGR